MEHHAEILSGRVWRQRTPSWRDLAADLFVYDDRTRTFRFAVTQGQLQARVGTLMRVNAAAMAAGLFCRAR